MAVPCNVRGVLNRLVTMMQIVPIISQWEAFAFGKIIQSKVFHDLTLGFGKLEVID